MTVSRNPVEFLRRHAFVNEPPQPKPRLDVGALLVHTIPLAKPKPAQEVLQQFEGMPPPDRGTARAWPDQPQ